MAFLAILPKAPEKYGRTRFESEALARRNFVLGSMEDNGWITAAQRDAARAMQLGLTDSGNRAVGQVGGSYMEEVRRQLIDRKGTRMYSSDYCASRLPSSGWKKKQITI